MGAHGDSPTSQLQGSQPLNPEHIVGPLRADPYPGGLLPVPTYQPGLRDLRQRHLWGGRQGAWGLLLLRGLFDIQTCQGHEGGGMVRDGDRQG